eukprot:8935899-Pyramimonas_sp.AAC.1
MTQSFVLTSRLQSQAVVVAKAIVLLQVVRLERRGKVDVWSRILLLPLSLPVDTHLVNAACASFPTTHPQFGPETPSTPKFSHVAYGGIVHVAPEKPVLLHIRSRWHVLLQPPSPHTSAPASTKKTTSVLHMCRHPACHGLPTPPSRIFAACHARQGAPSG